MENLSLFSNSQSKTRISEEFRQFIKETISEVLVEGRVFDVQKRWLRRLGETEGVDCNALERNMADIIEVMEEWKQLKSKSGERMAKMLGKECYLTEQDIDGLLQKLEGGNPTAIFATNPTHDASMMGGHSAEDEYISECIKEVCIKGDSLSKYRTIIEKKYGVEFYQKCEGFVEEMKRSVDKKKFTNTSVTNLHYLARQIGVSDATVDTIVKHYTDKFEETELGNGVKDGYGVLIDSNFKYEGNFKDGKFDGQGTVYLADKVSYKGGWKDGRFDGYGVYYLAKSRYEGNWKNGMKNGYGIDYDDDGSRYEGNWKDDKKNGYGVDYYSNGARYEGNFFDNQKNGQGTYYYADGVTRYEGNFKDGKFNGQGSYYFPDGDKYEGNFKDGNYDGYGTLYFNNKVYYEGNWKDGKKNGYGIKYFDSGDRYEGNWKDNKFDGQGIMYFEDGMRCEGNWKEDKLNGQTIAYYKDGHIEKGFWVENERNGVFIRINADGKKMSATYKDGKKVVDWH